MSDEEKWVASEQSRLNALLLDSLPHPAMLIRRSDRVILAANKLAKEMGARIGKICWDSFGAEYCLVDQDNASTVNVEEVSNSCFTTCEFCKLDLVKRPEATISQAVEMLGRVWDIYWVPLDDEVFLHYAIDITEHIKEEAQRLSSFTQHQMILQSAMDGYWLVNRQGQIIEVNDAYCEMSGYSNAELLQMNVADLDILEGPDDVLNWIQRVIEKGEDRFESQHRRSDGSTYDVEVSIQFQDIEGGLFACFLRDVTEAKRVASALRESEEHYRCIVEDSPGYICCSDASGTITFVNRAYCEFFGKKSTELIGTEFKEQISESDRQAVMRSIAGLTVDYPSHTNEQRVISPDGEVAWQRWTNRAFFDDQGNVVSYHSVGTDITERKRFEAELIDRMGYLQTLLDTVPVGVVVVSPDSQFVSFNTVWQQMVGYESSELLQMKIADLTWPGDPVLDNSDIETAKRRETPSLHKHKRYVRKDGTFFWGDVRIAAMSGQDLMLGVVSDITEHKLALEALREKEARLRLLVENMEDVVSQHLPDGTITYVSPSCSSLMGFLPDEMIGNSAFDYIHPEDVKTVEYAVRSAVQSKSEQYRVQYRLRCQSGDFLYCESLGKLAYASDGRLVEIQCSNRDITERRMIEERLRRTQMLESLGVMAGGIAHDFNNLLAVIMGNTTLALYDSNAEQKEILNEAIMASEKARGLTQQLLTFAKGGNTGTKIASVASIIHDAAMFTSGGSSPSRCELSIPDDLWHADINASQIGQVIQNLVINASQAMPGGGVIYVKAENVELESYNRLTLPEGPYISITVTDTGVGIPEKYLDKIFDPYFSTKSQSGRGSGLGLAVANSVVQKHKGRIFVTSEPGRGATFQFFLPAIMQIAEEAKTDEEPEEKKQNYNILVMDDEVSLNRMITVMLSSVGHKVVCTVDGKEAIEVFAKAEKTTEPFDFVILDLTIPGGMGGVETLARLREINSSVKAIISSGYSENMPVGFSACLAKPYRKSDMLEVIKRIMGD